MADEFLVAPIVAAYTDWLKKQVTTSILRDAGIPRLSDEEMAARKALAEKARSAVNAALAQVTDPALRAVIDLHKPASSGSWPDCDGCDPGSYAESGARWPCSTIEALVGHIPGLTERDLRLL